MNLNNDECFWTCGFNSKNEWHEIGCPHQDWTKEQLLEVIKIHKKNNQILLERIKKQKN